VEQKIEAYLSKLDKQDENILYNLSMICEPKAEKHNRRYSEIRTSSFSSSFLPQGKKQDGIL